MKSNFNDLAVLLLRLAVGAVMWAHGAQKLLGLFGGHGPQGFVHFVVSMGMPPALGWLVVAIEFFGGLAVVLGVLSRLAALGFAVEMAVTIAKIHWANGFFMNWNSVGGKGEGFEYNLVLAAACLALFLVGPGRYALFGRTRNLLA
jgi:putative oxidoreductase